MDSSVLAFVGFLCCVFALIILGVGGGVVAFLRRRPQREDREVVIQALTQIRATSDPVAALDRALAALQRPGDWRSALYQSTTYPPRRAEATPPQSAAPSAAPLLPPAVARPPTEPVASGSGPTVSTPSAPITPPPAAPPVAAQGREWAVNWAMPNTTTLLLYLGAALMVIAIAVFTVTGWASLSPLTRWGVVLLVALAFLLTGEWLVRVSAPLRQAGETFRGLGTALLPFVALAYDRFVLNGQTSAQFWTVTGAALAGLHYLFYRVSHPGRLNAYLSALSLGIFALALPALFGLGIGPQGLALLVFTAALLLIAWRFAPDGPALLRVFLRGQVHPLAESHLVMAALGLLGSTMALNAFDDTVYALYFAGLTLVCLGLSRWFQDRLSVALALLFGGFASLALAVRSHSTLDMTEAAALTAWAWLLWLIAPWTTGRLPGGRPLFRGGAAAWAVVAALLAQALAPGGWQVALLGALTVLLALAASRERWPRLLVGAWAVLHLAVLALLRWLATGPPSATVPTLVWLALAAVWWVGLRWRRPAWAGPVLGVLFCLETATIPLFASAVEVLRSTRGSELRFGVSEPILTLAAPLLAVGWAAWSQWRRDRRVLGVAVVLALYALTAIAYSLNLPANLYAVLVLVLGVALVTLERRAPDYARPLLLPTGLILVMGAAWMGNLAVEGLRMRPPLALSQAATSQALLVSAALVYAWQTWSRRSEGLALITTALVYGVTVWLTLDYLPEAALPLVVLALGLASQAVGRYAPGRSAALIDDLGLLATVITPVMFLLSAWLLDVTPIRAGELALLLSAASLAGRGWRQARRGLVALGGLHLYLLFASVALADARWIQLQVYTAPLALLVLAYGWLYPASRRELELASATILLGGGAIDVLLSGAWSYILLLGGWGLLLLAVGITLQRRVLLVMGIVGLIAASLRPLWGVITALPPGLVIGLVALVLMGVAVWLILNRARFLPVVSSTPPDKTE